MPQLPLDRLETVPVNEVWQDEPRDFTPWLAENLSHLGDLLHADLALIDTEVRTGPFLLDILAKREDDGALVAVENQLTATDHDHLGKLITYAAGHEAKIVVWVAPKFRDEHRAALDWLNQTSAGEVHYFGIEIAATRIGNSPVAPLFRLLAQPNDWSEQVRITRDSDQAAQFSAFYTPVSEKLISIGFADKEYAKSYRNMTLKRAARDIFYRAGFNGDGTVSVQLWINNDNPEVNQRIFDALKSHRDAITEEIESDSIKVSWTGRPNGRKGAEIAVHHDGKIDGDAQSHQKLQAWIIEVAPLLRDALQERLNKTLGELGLGNLRL